MNPPPDRLPHVLKGMAKAFVVRAADETPTPRSEPEASVVIRLVDYSFILSTPLTAGRQMIRVENHGTEPHEVALVMLTPGKTMEDLSAWIEKLEGPPPASSLGGVSSLAAKTEAYFEVDLIPGDYALFCLVTAPDGRPHTKHGMIKHIHVG